MRGASILLAMRRAPLAWERGYHVDNGNTYGFSPAQLERLAIYRAAAQGGFYTDALRPGEPEHISSTPLQPAPAPEITRHEKVGLRFARMRSHGRWTDDMYPCVGPALNTDGTLSGWLAGLLGRLDGPQNDV